MRSVLSRCFLLATAVLAVIFAQGLRGRPAMAQSQTPSNSEPWLDQAVAVGHCPLTPVNLPYGFQPSADVLRKRISIVNNTLLVRGTRNPDHILIRSGGASGFVRVRFDGIYLGAFGPAARILVQGGSGDNVIIVGPRVGLPARLEGGPRDDCLQSGSGGDQLLRGGGNDVLIAGIGRPALQTGSGHSRIVIRQRMGTLRIMPSAKSLLLPLLSSLYRLRSLTQDLGSSSGSDGKPRPIILTPADLAETGIVPLLQQTYAAGQSIVLLRATAAQAARLRALLGQPSAAEGLKRGEKAALIYFRKSPRPGSTAFDYGTGIIQRANLAAALSGSKERITELLSRIFSATAIVGGIGSPLPPPSGDPSNDLQDIANSYESDMTGYNLGGSQVTITNTAWAARSFDNQADFYYVQQYVDCDLSSHDAGFAGWFCFADNGLVTQLGVTPTVIDPLPQTTQCTYQTASGVTFSVGGSAGWNKSTGLNATVNAGVSVTNTSTTICPGILITNSSRGGKTHWEYDMPAVAAGHEDSQTFDNQWMWKEPFNGYEQGQQSVVVSSEAQSLFYNEPGPLVDLDSVIPVPFGDTFALQNPAVVSVSSQDNPGSTCVIPGKNFTINGIGLYPSLVTSVLINGTPLDPGSYSTISDTGITVTAPSSLASSRAQTVVVKTEKGSSNDDITVTISSSCPASS
jgi:hypothetical protein